MTDSLENDLLAMRGTKTGADNHRAYVGPPGLYDYLGAAQFRLLTMMGLREEHRLLDFGCGSLRAGRLFIPWLLPGRYFGIEPNRWLIDDAIRLELGSDMMGLRNPRFDDNDQMRMDVFGTDFDNDSGPVDLFAYGSGSVPEGPASDQGGAGAAGAGFHYGDADRKSRHRALAIRHGNRGLDLSRLYAFHRG